MRASWAILMVFSLMGCVRMLPPPQAAERSFDLRSLRVGPPTPETTRVGIDVQEGPARVEELFDGPSTILPARAPSASWDLPALVEYAQTTTRYVCRSPCIAEFAPGAHRLRFSLLDPAAVAQRFGGTALQSGATITHPAGAANAITLSISDRASLVRVALGQRRDALGWHLFAMGLFAVGGAGVTLSGVFLPSVLASRDATLISIDVTMLVFSCMQLVAGTVVVGTSTSVFQSAGYRVEAFLEPSR